jgi:bacteriocin biosynthesis cyclodehydratase domain-containing protein
MPFFQKPLLPSSFLAWTEPPDEAGDEVFRIVSWRRSLTLKGHSFREFARSVLPLLDGKRSLDEIHAQTADLFARVDLEAALELLGTQGILVEGTAPETDAPPRLAPQINYLGEVAEEGRAAQRHLGAARVVVVGMGGAGASLARSLGVAGVGRIACADPYDVQPTDLYFAALFDTGDIGRNRAECAAAHIREAAPEIDIRSVVGRLDDPAEIDALIQGADLVISCLESGDLNTILKLNRCCRAAGVRWLTGALEGPSIVGGPGFPPSGEGPCYMCYRMREVACAANPQSRFALERRLDRQKQDLGGRRENLACGADILAGLLGAEALNILARVSDPALDGRILLIDLTNLRQEKHVVLRKPGCPVCGSGSAA